VLDDPNGVIRCLLTYTDWWQPASSSVYHVAGGRDRRLVEAFRPDLLDHLDERSELCRRMRNMSDRDRRLLYLWYLAQLPVEDIAKSLRISRRQCFRRRTQAIRAIVEAGTAEGAA
jgi:DNA-directed RNA polymerase specialized sigma subunit